MTANVLHNVGDAPVVTRIFQDFPCYSRIWVFLPEVVLPSDEHVSCAWEMGAAKPALQRLYGIFNRPASCWVSEKKNLWELKYKLPLMLSSCSMNQVGVGLKEWSLRREQKDLINRLQCCKRLLWPLTIWFHVTQVTGLPWIHFYLNVSISFWKPSNVDLYVASAGKSCRHL